MSNASRVVAPGPDGRSVKTEDGTVLPIPQGWELLPPGDAGLTRRVKAAGPTWTVKEKKGRRVFSRGVWAPAEHISAERERLETERSSDSYKKRREADARRRDQKQERYVADFENAVYEFLRFDSRHDSVAREMARLVSEHATPVGSGTVARTQRIPIERRAESAVIAWMRHQTTAYDQMKIPRVKGKRREVRRMLAAKSRQLLDVYRQSGGAAPEDCPIRSALKSPT